jgi:hypothetical protein
MHEKLLVGHLRRLLGAAAVTGVICTGLLTPVAASAEVGLASSNDSAVALHSSSDQLVSARDANGI